MIGSQLFPFTASPERGHDESALQEWQDLLSILIGSHMKPEQALSLLAALD